MTPASLPRMQPLATLMGVGLGLSGALMAAVVTLDPLEPHARPLLPFALAVLPALLGLWFDWARLWKPSPRTRFWSAALGVMTALAAFDVALVAEHATTAFFGAALLPVGLAIGAQLGARAALAVTGRGRRWLGFDRLGGAVRRDELDRVVLDTPEGVVELDRRVPELGPHRSVDLSVGAPLTVLARTRALGTRDPYRAERRWQATSVLGVAASSTELTAVVRRRARAWTIYLVVLGLLAGLMAGAGACSTPTYEASTAPSRASGRVSGTT
jgi:hypothetical protein